MKERMAPGHVYQPKLGTGIEWTPGGVILWEDFREVEHAGHNTTSPYQFWRDLAFAEAFPSVTHWWFRSAWTQRVRLPGIQGMVGGGTVWGYMQFIAEDVPAQTWSISEGEPPEIFVPFPSNEVQPVNLPLRLALARLVAGVVADQVQRDTWMVVTSLVRREELAQTFPDTLDALPWKLEGVHKPIREALCNLQGLKKL
ncbi:MAG: hypothetical protein WA821_23925 [Anaerolineales bacterium]